MALFKNKLEFLVDADKPVEEINAVISAFISIHQDSQFEILNEVNKAIETALSKNDQLEVANKC